MKRSIRATIIGCTLTFMMICLSFPDAQQDHVLIAQPSQGTVHGIELDDTLWIMLDNALNERSELYPMQCVHLPDLGVQVRPTYDAQCQAGLA